MKPFDPTQDHRVLIPEGEYRVAVSHAYERVSKNGNPYLSVGLKVVDDETAFKGRIIWRNFFLEGDPENYATQRSGEELSSLCRVASITEIITEPKQLINGVVFDIEVKHYKTSSGVLGEDVRYYYME
ncbi:DUF669 domain-containing protein [Pasteurella canis]|uniref:DUF669 domain-containing protein n=1 Tax=Pasteurella canis TaxID=753 RepID=UPI000668B1CC|nr:DUF669 domain-containing protein [Pasteurella canis]UDW84591.1 DUF669 domain-containing protein [Pasteurella canis]